MSKSLLKATAAGRDGTVESLLDAGAEIDFIDKPPGRTALIEAVIGGHADTVRLLIGRRANLDLCDRTLGYTALGWAANTGNLEIAQLLLAANAQVDLTASEFQLTPLMVASQTGHRSVAEALLVAGANVHMQTGNGRNALSLAEGHRDTETAAVLRRYGAIAPQLQEETFLDWPELTENLSNVEDSDPVSVLRGFILAMNRWEEDCQRHKREVGSKSIDWACIQKQQESVFTAFCTPGPRPQGRQGSFSSPPEYSPDETLVSVEVVASRASIVTRQAPQVVLRNKVQYTMVRKNRAWRVDGRKNRPWGTQVWGKGIL